MLVTKSSLWLSLRPSFKNCSIYVVGIQGDFSDKVMEKFTNFRCFETVTGNFNSLLSRKKSLFFLSLAGQS